MNPSDIETIVKTLAEDIRMNGGVLADSTQSVLVKCIAAGICALFAFVFYVNSQIVGINSKLEGGVLSENHYKMLELPQELRLKEVERKLETRLPWVQTIEDRINKLERVTEKHE